MTEPSDAGESLETRHDLLHPSPFLTRTARRRLLIRNRRLSPIVCVFPLRPASTLMHMTRRRAGIIRHVEVGLHLDQ